MKILLRIGAGLLIISLGAMSGLAQTTTKGDKSVTPPLSIEDVLKQFKMPTDAKEAAQAADSLEKNFAGMRMPESVRMLIAILRGSQLGPGEGWFGPAQTRYTWEWLAARQGVDPKAGVILKSHFSGPASLYLRLDRNADGRITPDDLDWSDRNPWVQEAYVVNRLLRRMNTAGDGRLTKDELLKFFDKTAQGKDYVTTDDLRQALFGGISGGFLPGDAPTRDLLLRGLLTGEVGSLHEGPAVDQEAPHFKLKTPDGKETIELSKQIGAKPVVLFLGNFTCGPFRSFYPDVEAVYHRHKEQATFLMVYVREAHPADGWKMASNQKVGVEVKQPTNLDERCAVANQFCQRLKPAIPVVVDEISDPVGNAYSGMPARLYVIDTMGKVAYKSGRGPFGFRVGEMEQALSMALLEQQLANVQPAGKNP
jgi:hypothetical protein